MLTTRLPPEELKLVDKQLNRIERLVKVIPKEHRPIAAIFAIYLIFLTIVLVVSATLRVIGYANALYDVLPFLILGGIVCIMALFFTRLELDTNKSKKSREKKKDFKQVTIVTTPIQTTEKPFNPEAKKDALRKIRGVLELALYEIDNLKMRVGSQSSQFNVYNLSKILGKMPKVGEDIVRIANMKKDFIEPKNYTYLINLSKIITEMIQISENEKLFSNEQTDALVNRFKRNTKNIINKIDHSDW